MYIIDFRKNFLFVLFCFFSFVVFLLLGLWQLERLEWKEELIHKVEKNFSQNPSNFPIKELAENSDLEFRRVKFPGYFLHNEEILINGKYNRLKEIGSYIITPILLKDNTVVLANRGWAPITKKEEMAEISRSPIETDILGMLNKGEKTPWFVPKNKPDEGVWLWAEFDQLLKFSREKLPNYVVRPTMINIINENNELKYPSPLPTDFKIRNDHLQYAITWFSLAILTIVMTIIFIRKD